MVANDWLRAHGPATAKDYVGAQGVAKTTALARLEDLHEQGLATREKVGRAYVYEAARLLSRRAG